MNTKKGLVANNHIKVPINYTMKLKKDKEIKKLVSFLQYFLDYRFKETLSLRQYSKLWGFKSQSMASEWLKEFKKVISDFDEVI